MERQGAKCSRPRLWMLFPLIAPPVTDPLVRKVAHVEQCERVICADFAADQQIVCPAHQGHVESFRQPIVIDALRWPTLLEQSPIVVQRDLFRFSLSTAVLRQEAAKMISERKLEWTSPFLTRVNERRNLAEGMFARLAQSRAAAAQHKSWIKGID